MSHKRFRGHISKSDLSKLAIVRIPGQPMRTVFPQGELRVHDKPLDDGGSVKVTVIVKGAT